MGVKLYDSELKVMELLWKEGDLTAKQLAMLLAAQVGWNKNTSYTVIKKCIEKGAILRTEPHFVCHALISKGQTQALEVNELVEKLFDGSTDLLFASLLGQKKLPAQRIAKLRAMAEEWAEEEE